MHVTSLPCANEVCVGLCSHRGRNTPLCAWTNEELMVNLLHCALYKPLNVVKHCCNFTAFCKVNCCVGCIPRCEMQSVTRLGERGIAVEIFTLFTQAVWHVTPSKYTYNCHCTCKLYDYCTVGANNVVVCWRRARVFTCVAHWDASRTDAAWMKPRLRGHRSDADYVIERALISNPYLYM